MSQGTLYLNLASPRSSLFKDLVEYLDLDIKISGASDPVYIAKFPLKKLPTFVGKNDFVLHEAIALLIYLISLKSPSNTYKFYGQTLEEQGQTWKWVSFVNAEMISTLCDFIYPLNGNLPYNAAGVESALKTLNSFADIFESQLKKSKYLVSNDYPTLADIWAVQSFRWGFQTCWDKKWLAKHPYINKWFNDIITNDPIASRSLKGFAPVDQAMKNASPKL